MSTLPPFQELIDAHGRDLHRFLVSMVGPHNGDDCFQEAMVSALRAYPSLRSATNLRSWLFTIGYRKGIDMIRRAKRERVTDSVPDAGTEDRHALDPDLWRRVDGLPDKQRAAVTLRFVGDLAYAEIGQIIECSEAAARQNVRAGLTSLRGELVS